MVMIDLFDYATGIANHHQIPAHLFFGFFSLACPDDRMTCVLVFSVNSSIGKQTA